MTPFKGSFPPDRARWTEPYVDTVIDFTDLTGGAAADEIVLAGPQALPYEITRADFFNLEAWTVGGGSSTALALLIGTGTANDDDAYMVSTALVGLAVNRWALGNNGAECGVVKRLTHPTLRARFVASGGTPDIAHVDGGRGIVRLWYRAYPEMLAG